MLHKHAAGPAPFSCRREEAAAGARVAGRSLRPDPEQDGVGIAVEAPLDHVQVAARGGAFLPEPPAAGVEPGPPGLHGPAPGLLVHVGHHQHLGGVGVLDHRRHQAPGEVGLAHRRISRPRPARCSLTSPIVSSPKWKMVAARAASAPPSVSARYMWSAVAAPPEAITGRRTASLTARVSSSS